jgi:predicted flap endonuclease-1-like 5' DNA nuclease
MIWSPELPSFDEAQQRARRAAALPIGLASPLWLAFGAAAGAGVAWWWATRWTRTHLEADLAQPIVSGPVEVVLEPEDAAPEPARAETPAEAGDDLTRLTGIGPKLAQALADRGITSFAQLAAWTEDNAAAFDAELSLKGRVARDAWVAQARRLASDSISG